MSKQVNISALLEASIKDGYITKETSHKNWRSRYAILTQDALYLFLSPTDDYVKLVIPLGPGTELFDLDKGPGLLKGFYFTIIAKCTKEQMKNQLFNGADNKEYFLNAISKQDKYSWMNAMGLLIAGKVEAAIAYGNRKQKQQQNLPPLPNVPVPKPPLPSPPSSTNSSSGRTRPPLPSHAPPPPPPLSSTTSGRKPSSSSQQQQTPPKIPERRARRSMSCVGFDELCGGDEETKANVLSMVHSTTPPKRPIPQAPTSSQNQKQQQRPPPPQSSPPSTTANSSNPRRAAPIPPNRGTRPQLSISTTTNSNTKPKDDVSQPSPRRQKNEFEQHHQAAENVRKPTGFLGWVGSLGRSNSSQQTKVKEQQQKQAQPQQNDQQTQGRYDICGFCGSAIVVGKDRILVEGKIIAHRDCFKCTGCNKPLDPVNKDYMILEGAYYCIPHYHLVVDHQADADKEESEYQENVRKQQQQPQAGGHWQINWNKKNWAHKEQPKQQQQ